MTEGPRPNQRACCQAAFFEAQSGSNGARSFSTPSQTRARLSPRTGVPAMKATALPALALLLLAGALRADPPGVIGRIEKADGRVRRAGNDPAGPVDAVFLPPGATDADLAGLCELRGLETLALL